MGLSEAQQHWQGVGTTLSATALAALTLTACGSDNNAGTSLLQCLGHRVGSAAECGGKNSLTAEGSTAQQNAIAEFNKVWGQVCSGKTLAYNPTGSGAGAVPIGRAIEARSRRTSP